MTVKEAKELLSKMKDTDTVRIGCSYGNFKGADIVSYQIFDVSRNEQVLELCMEESELYN